MTTPFRASLSRGARELLRRYYDAETTGREPPGDRRHINALCNFLLLDEITDDQDPFRYRISGIGKNYINPESDGK